MPQPIAATGNCGWCGERALLYLRGKDNGSEMERPACRPCIERGCGARAKHNWACDQNDFQNRIGMGEENDKSMCGEQSHLRSMSMQVQSPQVILSQLVRECEPRRLPMAICVTSSNEILCRKRANGSVGIDGVGMTGVYQCGSITPGGGGAGELDTGLTNRSPYKRQRTAFSEA